MGNLNENVEDGKSISKVQNEDPGHNRAQLRSTEKNRKKNNNESIVIKNVKKQNKKFLSQQKDMIEYVDGFGQDVILAIDLAEEYDLVKEIDEFKQFTETLAKYR